MQCLIHEDSQLEVDPLSHRQPMKLSEDRSDVVMTPGACDEPNCMLHFAPTADVEAGCL